MSSETPETSSILSVGNDASAAPAADKNAELQPPDELAAVQGTYCPQCGFLVHFDTDRCPQCGRMIYHHPSVVQKNGLLGGLGFIFLGGVCIFFQPRAYHTWTQDLVEVLIISCVAGAAICFFLAVADMVRRGGE